MMQVMNEKIFDKKNRLIFIVAKKNNSYLHGVILHHLMF